MDFNIGCAEKTISAGLKAFLVGFQCHDMFRVRSDDIDNPAEARADFQEFAAGFAVRHEAQAHVKVFLGVTASVAVPAGKAAVELGEPVIDGVVLVA